jgi:hypothetical protein
VAVSVIDPAMPNRYLSVRRVVVAVTQAGAIEHIHRLAIRYSGQIWDPPAHHVRQIYKIKPLRVYAETV